MALFSGTGGDGGRIYVSRTCVSHYQSARDSTDAINHHSEVETELWKSWVLFCPLATVLSSQSSCDPTIPVLNDFYNDLPQHG